MKPYALNPACDRIQIRLHYARKQSATLEIWKKNEPETLMEFPSEAKKTHHWEITGLEPDTTYEYGRKGRPREGSFRTLPANGKIRIGIFGDPQGHSHLQQVTSAVAKYKPDLAVCLGDNAHRPDLLLYQDFFRKTRRLLGRTALISTPGNHDYESCSPPFNGKNPISGMYKKWFGDEKLNCTATSFGPFKLLGIAFPDRNSLTEKCRNWLRKELESARKHHQKVILFHHCPCFTSTTITWALDAETLPPILEEYKDIVLADFAGHIHTYEFSKYPEDDGVWYVTSGGAGELYDFPVKSVHNPYEKSSADIYHSILLDLAPGKMVMRVVGEDGKILEKHPYNWSR